ncbi:hypothetical protein EV178_000944 [Coemansia sp. RSA 1646]|nr:hypothetical protein EV178_000944 [Coemansia sp. RSA 1646]KAJ1773047.1 hypothetical protein LPJ74_000998 [Coemansia sp. RSA 1843]
MNRQHRSVTVGSDDVTSPEIPAVVYGPGSPLARGRTNRRRRSALHDMLERARKRQEQKDQEAARFLATNASAASDPKPKARQHPLSIPQPISPSDAQAHSLPQEPETAAARTVHKAELQFRRPSEDGGSEEPQPKTPLFTMGKSNKRSPLIQRRAENQALRLMSASKASRESMEKGSATPSDSFERLTGVDPLALSKKRSGQFPYRIERTYRVAGHSKDSDNDESGKLSDKDEGTSPSSSPLSAVFQLPPVLPPPQQQKDLPPLPAPLQKQLKQLPRLSPPRKLPMTNKPTLQLGLPDPALPITPVGTSQSASRRVVSGSSLLRSPSSTSFNDAQARPGMHILGPEPPVSAKVGKGQATEVFRRVGYWLYSTAPVQFIKHAMVEERNDSVNVLFSTDKSIWLLGVSYRLRKNTRSVILPSAIQADSTQLRIDSSLFLNHHHQKRSASPSRTNNPRKADAAPQRRSEDVGNRRRANTSGVMMNKKKLQSIAQLQNYPGVPPLPEPGTPGMPGIPLIQGTRPLASIPSQDLLLSRQGGIGIGIGIGGSSTTVGPTPISPMPFPDDPVTESVGRLGQETDNDVEIDSDSIISTTKKNSHLTQQQHLQPVERPKSSKMGRLRSWVARTAKPMRRKSDALSENQTKDCGGSSSTSRPASPQPSHPLRLSNDAPQRIGGTRTPSLASAVARTSTNVSTNFSNGSDPRALGIAIPSQATHLRRKSKETLTSVSGSYAVSDGMRRSWYESDAGSSALPPVPPMPIPSMPDTHSLASVGGGGSSSSYYDGRSAALNRNPGIASSIQLRPLSSHSHAQSQNQRRIASGSSNHTNNSSSMVIGPTRREATVRSLISDFASWESPTSSIMMFQREWKLPSFQQLITMQSATAWAKETGWTVTLSSETFVMAHIFYNLPKDVTAVHNHAAGEKIPGDRLLLRMRLAMEDMESKFVVGEVWRDSITAIVLAIDARAAPKCPVPTTKRNLSQGSLEASERALQGEMSPEDHIRRMKVLEKHLAKVTDSFSQHFWPRQEDQVAIFNTYPRSRNDEANSRKQIEKRANRRTRGWNMIPTLLTFKPNKQEQAMQPPSALSSALPERPESPSLSIYTRKRHLYPMGLSISPSNTATGAGDNHGASSFGSSRDLSVLDAADDLRENASRSVSRATSRPASPPHGLSPPKSPALSPKGASPPNNRTSAYSHLSAGGNGRPSSPVYKRGTLGLQATSSNDVATLTDELGQGLSIAPRPPPLQSTSSQSSGGSGGFNVNSTTSLGLRQTSTHGCNESTILSATSAGSMVSGKQRKRKAGEFDVVGRTKGGFEIVWSTTDTLSTSYVMVPVPKAAASPESPTKIHKPSHSRLNEVDAETAGTQSQPNLKRVLESITREINLDSSYVLLLPPPPPIELSDRMGEDDDEFGYLAGTLLRRVKSEIVMHRTLQEFEHEFGLDLINDNDSDSFQMIDASDDGSSHNSVYFSAEDDTATSPSSWYRRLSGSSPHAPLMSHRPWQQSTNALSNLGTGGGGISGIGGGSDVSNAKSQQLTLNQLTLLEFFMDGMRRFYFTYRKGFPTITPSFYTSDMGWGCTYRTCQMMLAESFSRVLLGRFWDPFRLSPLERTRHGRIIEWFYDGDTPRAYYSIHNMARTATHMDKRIGDWLGPSIAAHVMKRQSNKHPNCPLTIHVAIDQTVYASEVRKQGLSHYKEGADQPSWQPLLLLVPVRLGLSRLNLGYIPKIKTLFQIPQSVGLVGGKPSRSFYFIGRQGDNLFYLDPHVTRQHVPLSRSGNGENGGVEHCDLISDSGSDTSDFELFDLPETEEYHTTHICSMPIHRLDPSMLLGFLFNTEAEWDTFVLAATDKESHRSICTGTSPLFTLLSGSSMMTPQFDAMVDTIPGQMSKAAAATTTDAIGLGGRRSPRANSDTLPKSPLLKHQPDHHQQPSYTPVMSPSMATSPPPPPLTRMRSASSPRFTSTDANLIDGDGTGAAATGEDDEFEML